MANLLTPRTHDYDGYAAILGDRYERRIGHNTSVIRVSEDSVGIRLHWTTVVTFHRDGRIWLNSGGYQSVTTKQRMNAVLPQHLGVVQSAYIWYVTNRRDGSRHTFHDGYEIPSDTPVAPVAPVETPAHPEWLTSVAP